MSLIPPVIILFKSSLKAPNELIEKHVAAMKMQPGKSKLWKTLLDKEYSLFSRQTERTTKEEKEGKCA